MKLLRNNSTDVKKVKLQVYVSPVDHEHLVTDAGKCGITVSELVRAIVRTHYDGKLGRN